MKDIRFPPSLKAEVLLNIVSKVHSGVATIAVEYDGNFRRNYLHDIQKFETQSVGNAQVVWRILLNRDSFYDRLPEGLFHEIDRFVKLESSNDRKSFKDEYEKQKNEIEFSRKFFQPFDNLFFDLSLKLEQHFFDLVKNTGDTILKFYFGQQNKMLIPEGFLKKILGFLPYFSRLRSNLNHIRYLISYVFNAEVKIEQYDIVKLIKCSDSFLLNKLNNNILGKDLYCGNSYYDFTTTWQIDIIAGGSLLKNLLESKDYQRMIDFICGSLVPAGVQCNWSYFSRSYNKVQLSQKKEDTHQYLGFNVEL